MSLKITFEGYNKVGKTTTIKEFKSFLNGYLMGIGSKRQDNIIVLKQPTTEEFGKKGLKYIKKRNSLDWYEKDKIRKYENLAFLAFDEDRLQLYGKNRNKIKDKNSIIIFDRSFMSSFIYTNMFISKNFNKIYKLYDYYINNEFFVKSDINFILHNETYTEHLNHPANLYLRTFKFKNAYDLRGNAKTLYGHEKNPKLNYGKTYYINSELEFKKNHKNEYEVSAMKNVKKVFKILRKEKLI